MSTFYTFGGRISFIFWEEQKGNKSFAAAPNSIDSLQDLILSLLHADCVGIAIFYSPELTWRDVQYLIVYTSNTEATNATDSVTNGAGLSVSHQVGFGVIDAEAMVTRATRWTNVPPLMTEDAIPFPSSG